MTSTSEKTDKKLRSVIDTIGKLDIEFKDKSIRGVNPWFLVRVEVYSRLKSYVLGNSQSHDSYIPRKLRKIVPFLIWSAVRNPYFWIRRKSIIVFSSGVVNIQQGSVYINRLYDSFTLQGKHRVSLVEDPGSSLTYLRPRQIARLSYGGAIDALSKVCGRMWRLPIPLTREIESFAEAVAEFLDDTPYPAQEMKALILDLLLQRYSAMRFAKRFYLLLFYWKKPRAVIGEDASYGSRAAQIAACNQLGIPTCEIQHGMITSSHLAYNLSPSSLKNSTYHTCFPQYLLVLGEYYRTQVYTPSMVRVIGSPYIEELSANSTHFRTNPKNRRILVASQGTISEVFDLFLEGLCHQLPDNWSIIHKPHPGELGTYPARYPRAASIERVLLETSSIYALLTNVDAVLGCYSTVLYEAMAFGHVPLVIDHPLSRIYLDMSQFNIVSSPEEITESSLIQSRSTHRVSRGEQFWAPDSIQRWNEVISEITGSES